MAGMRSITAIAAYVFGVAIAPLACGTSSTPGGLSTDAAGADAGAVDAADASVADDTGTGIGPDGSCIVQTVKTCPQADDLGCDALLTLRNGMEFCTMSCASAADCPKGVGVVCNTDDGACEPSCVDDASCKAAGFFRCNKTVGACSTI